MRNSVAVRPAACAALGTRIRCPGCGELRPGAMSGHNLKVCPACGHHHRLDAHERVHQLFDEDGLRLLDVAAAGAGDAVVVVTGAVQGSPAVAAVMDFRFLGGSSVAAVEEQITVAAELALRRREPLLIVSASSNTHIRPGVSSLVRMAETGQALGRLGEAGLLTVALVTDATDGGVAASFAALCDVIVAEPRARLGFAGACGLDRNLRRSGPGGSASAEFLLAHGQIDMIRPRSALRRTLGRLLAVHRVDGPTDRPAAAPVVREPVPWPDADLWQHIRQPTDIDRPTTLDYLGLVFDEFEELRGDRLGADRTAIVGGLARLDGVPVMALGHQKSHEPAESEGHRKVARLVRLAAKLGLPVVTFVDAMGARAGTEAAETGHAVAVAENIRLMAALRAPVIALITGEGGGIGALALEVADEVLVCANAGYSVAQVNEAAAPRLDARQLLRLGMVDRVVEEPDGGCQADHELAARHVREALRVSLRALLTVDGRTLIAKRGAKFRSFSATAAAGVRHEGERLS